MAIENNAEVLPDLLAEETEQEMETPETEETAAESETAEQENAEKSKEVETLLAQKEHWRKKALKAEEETKKLKEVSKSGSVPDEEFRPRVEFLLENRDLDSTEYDHLATVALRNSGKITLESLRDAKELEKGYISYLRKQRSQQNKIPGSTSQSSISKYQKSPGEIAKMTSEEIMAYDKLMMENQSRGI